MSFIVHVMREYVIVGESWREWQQRLKLVSLMNIKSKRKCIIVTVVEGEKK